MLASHLTGDLLTLNPAVIDTLALIVVFTPAVASLRILRRLPEASRLSRRPVIVAIASASAICAVALFHHYLGNEGPIRDLVYPAMLALWVILGSLAVYHLAATVVGLQQHSQHGT